MKKVGITIGCLMGISVAFLLLFNEYYRDRSVLKIEYIEPDNWKSWWRISFDEDGRCIVENFNSGVEYRDKNIVAKTSKSIAKAEIYSLVENINKLEGPAMVVPGLPYYSITVGVGSSRKEFSINTVILNSDESSGSGVKSVYRINMAERRWLLEKIRSLRASHQ